MSYFLHVNFQTYLVPSYHLEPNRREMKPLGSYWVLTRFALSITLWHLGHSLPDEFLETSSGASVSLQPVLPVLEHLLLLLLLFLKQLLLQLLQLLLLELVQADSGISGGAGTINFIP